MKFDSQVMLDIETLSTKKTAAIVSIGAVRFAAHTGKILDTFKINIDPRNCKSLGLHFEKKTIAWWSEQAPEARKGWQTDPKPLKFALEQFSDWYGTKSINTWAKGVVFDCSILENAFDVCALPCPWKPFQICDYRTLLTVLGINDKKLKSADSVYHDALSDAIEQTKVLIPILQAFSEFEAF